MENKKKKRLEEKGWKVGTAQEFLGLTPAEVEYIELKLMLSENLKKRRQRKKLNQVELAKLLKSNQARVAKMETGDASVSLDNLIQSLLVLGATKQDLARIIASPEALVSSAL
ncbi:helix-turn-helix domain-containing protein [candidate division KSB1 bacterium]|nr:helix-turn-helix domain-containing protein [candidate division KSB1 bacterium]